MKKFFSILAAVLFAGSMMAEVTILPTDFTAVENSDYSVTKDGVTVAVTASTVTNEQMRIFKGKTITISSESNISSIVFTCTANGTSKYGPGCFNAQDGYTFESAGKTGTWTGSATSVTFTAESNQVRATQIVVTLGEGGGNEGEGGGSEGEFSYDYEPEEVSTFDVEMSTAEVEDYTAEFGVVAMYFESADGSYFASMELIISSEDLVEPGEYQINDSEEEGTFFASPGGDDEYDYGCYFGVTFIDPEDGKEYYDPYYLVSGNVTITEDGIQVQAKSYNGSTVKFTYVQPYDAVENTKLTDKLLKAIENGNVIIKSGNVIFDVNGQRIK